MTEVAVIVIVHQRHDHLLLQLKALAASDSPPRHIVLVAMNDPAVSSVLPTEPAVHVVELESTGALPLAAARNLGAATALALGAEVLVFFDVDCLPAPEAVGAYAAAALAETTGDRLLCGPVTYLPPAPAGGYDLARLPLADDPHPARPAPAPGEVLLGAEHELFWSLSFALRARTWSRLGGFCEEYAGYGGEDTDFAFTARAAGVDLAWIGDARAYHQHHPVHDPPLEHVADIVRNATVFRTRWGAWPMRGWLDDFEQRGLIRRDEATLVII